MSLFQDEGTRGGQFLAAGLLLVAGLACPASEAVAAPAQIRANAGQVEPLPIVGGTTDATCAHPSTVSFGYCSGTLVHPQVVLTAAHCNHESRARNVYIGSSAAQAQAVGKIEYCASYPGFDGEFGRGTDWAYCVLEKPLLNVPITPPAMGCELEYLNDPNARVTLVGFGRDENNQRGRKRSVEVAVSSVQDGEVRVGGDGKAGCHGDSGGSAYITLPDQTRRLLGMISYAKGECGTPEYVVLAHRAIAWIEGELAGHNIDLTPCTDSSGNWLPSDECRFAKVSTAYSDQLCVDGNQERAWSTTCGPAKPDFVGPVETEPFLGDPQWEPADNDAWENLGIDTPPHAERDKTNGCEVARQSSLPTSALLCGFVLAACRRRRPLTHST